MSALELKCCPFCAGEAEIVSVTQHRHYVRCMCCEQQFEHGTEASAVAAWNRRAPAPHTFTASTPGALGSDNCQICGRWNNEPETDTCRDKGRVEAVPALKVGPSLLRAAERLPPSNDVVAALHEAERFLAYFAGETDGVFVGPGTPKSALAQIRAALSPAPAGGWRPTHRHKKRGSTYRVVGEGRIQCDMALKDMAYVTIYQGEKGDLWARPTLEFEDGRFEPLPVARSKAEGK
jgi:hypothetical protein